MRDAWMYTGNKEALDMFLRLCDWGVSVTEGLSDNQMEQMLANEFGGMDEILPMHTRLRVKKIFDYC